jgi:hypothetical protein
MSADVLAALEQVRQHGVMLASAKGKVPRLIEAILGAPVEGNWWAHPRGNFIYNVLSEVTESKDVLVCRLIDGKISLVHRRLWPALVRVAHRVDPARLAWVREEHTPTGRHVRHEIAYPHWVPSETHASAVLLSEQEALALLGPAVGPAVGVAGPVRKRGSRA